MKNHKHIFNRNIIAENDSLAVCKCGKWIELNEYSDKIRAQRDDEIKQEIQKWRVTGKDKYEEGWNDALDTVLKIINLEEARK